MDFQTAQQLSESLGGKLSDLGKRSYPKLSPVPNSEGSFVVEVVLHPDEADLQQDFPSAPFVPWSEFAGDQYVEKTPRTPSRRDSPYDDFYPSAARRRHEPSTHYPDVNPNYPGLRRVPDIQDLVRRVAMRSDLASRLVKVDRVLASAERLGRFAKIGRYNESVRLVEDLLADMKVQGHNGRHKCVRLVKKLKDAMQSDGYNFA